MPSTHDSTGDGPRATPTWDDGRIYALGATGELRCLDAKTGAVVWGKNILKRQPGVTILSWAMAASPLIVDDKVIVLPGGTAGKSVVAYNKMTGAPVWKALNDTQAYVSPMLVTLAGRRQIIVVSSTRVVGLVPEDGSLLWSYTWDTDMGINVSQPIMVVKNRFFISAGYGKGAALVEVTGSGKSLTARTVWENINMKNKFNSSVLHEGHVYGLDEGILTCLDVNTGERKWKGGRYGYGQVILASGNLIVSERQRRSGAREGHAGAVFRGRAFLGARRERPGTIRRSRAAGCWCATRRNGRIQHRRSVVIAAT